MLVSMAVLVVAFDKVLYKSHSRLATLVCLNLVTCNLHTVLVVDKDDGLDTNKHLMIKSSCSWRVPCHFGKSRGIMAKVTGFQVGMAI